MANMNRLFKSLVTLSWWGLIVLIIGTPIHAFVSTFLLYGIGMETNGLMKLFLQGWKEGLILALAGVAILFLVFKRAKLKVIQYLIIGFVVVGLAVTMANWADSSWAHLIWGARTEFSFLILLFALLTLVDFWSQKQKKLVVNVALVTGIVIMIFGVLLGVVGYDFLTNFGYRNDWSTFYVGEAPAFCQREAGTSYCRWQSLLVGPNRYAGYLLTLLPMLWFLVKDARYKIGLIIIGIISLIATLSTAGVLGLIAMIAGYLIWTNWSKIKKINNLGWWLGGLVILGTVVFLMLLPTFLQKATNLDHYVRSMKALEQFLAQPLGSGLAASGPASFKVGVGSIPENWFLQVAVNTGIGGIVLFLMIIVVGVRDLFKRAKLKLAKIAMLALLGIMIQNLFLHTLEDASVFVIMVTLVALALYSNPEHA